MPSASHGPPATYDVHYLALAEHLGCELWMDHERLLRHAAESLFLVRWLSDHPVNAV